MDRAHPVNAGAHGLDDLQAAGQDAQGQRACGGADGPERDLCRRGAKADPNQDHEDACRFLRIVKGMVKRQEYHIDILGVPEEGRGARGEIAGEQEQPLHQQPADQEAEQRGQEDHQHDAGPEISPGDGPPAKGHNACADHAADQCV